MSEEAKFKDALRHALSVPKKTIDARAAAAKRKRMRKRRSKANAIRAYIKANPGVRSPSEIAEKVGKQIGGKIAGSQVSLILNPPKKRTAKRIKRNDQPTGLAAEVVAFKAAVDRVGGADEARKLIDVIG